MCVCFSGYLWYLQVKLPPTVNLLQDKGKLMDFLLRRRDCKMVILSVCSQSKYGCMLYKYTSPNKCASLKNVIYPSKTVLLFMKAKEHSTSEVIQVKLWFSLLCL